MATAHPEPPLPLSLDIFLAARALHFPIAQYSRASAARTGAKRSLASGKGARVGWPVDATARRILELATNDLDSLANSLSHLSQECICEWRPVPER